MRFNRAFTQDIELKKKTGRKFREKIVGNRGQS